MRRYQASLGFSRLLSIGSAHRADVELLESKFTLSSISFLGYEVESGSDANHPTSVYAADLDGDSDVDVLSASREDGKVWWYENINGQGAFGVPHLISGEADGTDWVFAADVDGDHDLDVLWSSRDGANGEIAWHENTGGVGMFGPAQMIATEVATRGVSLADLDDDGDLDLLFSSSNAIGWYENIDGKGTFEFRRDIAMETMGVFQSPFAADLDSDGDIDVLWTQFHFDREANVVEGKISWQENTNGAGTFAAPRQTNDEAPFVTSVKAADMDGDGDLDVLSASNVVNAMWYENEGTGRFRSGGRLDVFAEQLHATDLNQDQDVDLLAAPVIRGATSFDSVPIAWYERLRGSVSFSEPHLVTSEVNRVSSLFAVDMNGDGDLDILSAFPNEHKIVWYDNRLAGDSNDNGEVDFGDFLALSASFGFENAVWEHGDFDGDRIVSFDDFLILSSNFGAQRPRAEINVSEAQQETHPGLSLAPLALEKLLKESDNMQGDNDEEVRSLVRHSGSASSPFR